MSTTPVFLQSKPAETGPVCLAMLLGHYGSFPKLTDIKNACGSANDEIPPEHLLIVSRNFGLEAEILKLPFTELAQHRFPLLLTSESGKYILLVKRSFGRYLIHDPQEGVKTLTEHELEACYGGQALVARPKKDFVPIRNAYSFAGDIRKRVGQSKNAVAYVVMAGIIMLIPGIVIPALSKILFDDIILQGQTLWFKPMLTIMVAFLTLGSILIFIQQWVLLRIELKISLVESAKFVTHVLSIPYTYFQSHSSGDTIKRITLNDGISIMLSRDLTNLIINAVTVIVFATVMAKYSLPLMAAGVSVMLLNIIILNYFSSRRTALNQSLFEKQQKLFNTASDGIKFIETLKASGWENDFFSLWSGNLVSAINENQKLGFSSSFLNVIPEFLSQLNNVIVVLLGGALIMYGEISVGIFIAMQSFIANFSGPVKEMVKVAGNVQLNRSNLTNLKDTLDEPVDPLCKQIGRSTIDNVTPLNARLTGQLEVKNISFSYAKFGVPLIENFSLSAHPGKRIALVGGSGSGKSTLLKLISGLYAPISGDILYDGESINTINRDVLRCSVATVDQDVFLFTGTATDNIVMWNRAIGHDDVVAAGKDALAHDFLLEREGGYQSRIAPGGANLSGGQRQRIEIARALVMGPSIIVLDEATSALDAQTEKLVMENIRRRNCTTITIAHRLSTIIDYDEIIVMDMGKVVQRGTHEELILQKGGLYQELISLS